ncbi:nuclear transport factor 2 family protein [Trujillonella endophytica]|uniref:SnoaL-like domain-containing protein n=1 Tax=Trujillonella endophytica TaxID=673521 RepID=A0A1H8Q5G3_9ACTN|nr:nuclear transport factor 2 family protein [Trujillella endophytica]SEO49460.1 SnoaL-like domain-containing protein [Trujillella endophytica]
MALTVEDLLATQEITEALYRVARATDRADPELYAAQFHEDGEDHHGLVGGPVGNIIANLTKATHLVYSQHAISNVLVDLHGDVAHVESCFDAAHQARRDDGSLEDEFIRGRYLDRFERRDGGPWRIARRVVVWDWSRIQPSGESWFDRVRQRPGVEDRFVFGRRDRTDMVYDFELPAELRDRAGEGSR